MTQRQIHHMCFQQCQKSDSQNGGHDGEENFPKYLRWYIYQDVIHNNMQKQKNKITTLIFSPWFCNERNRNDLFFCFSVKTEKQNNHKALLFFPM